MTQPQILSSFLYLILVALFSFASSKPNGFSLNLIHIDSLESPFYLDTLSDSEKINRLIDVSLARAKYLGSSSISNPDALGFQLSQDFTTYLIKLNLGVPGVPQYLSPDTGSNLVWVQCEPCTHKYRQIPPIYNSSASITYRKIHCEDPFCKNNKPFFKCVKNECTYDQHYVSGSQTQGVVSREVFTSPPNNEQITITFGCSRDNINFPFFEHTGKSGGVLGLNKSPISLLHQLSDLTRLRFSYCLIPFSTDATQTSLLRFGNDIPTRTRLLSTPFVSAPHSDNYYLSLRDISIAGKPLKISRNTFAIKRDGTGGCIIDSGSAVTHLVSAGYRIVVSAFEKYFDQHGFHRVHLPRVDLELCYDNSHSSHDLPTLTYHFEGADFTVQPQFLTVLINDGHAFCVGLLQDSSISIIGALNQGNTRFIYDVGAGRLQFGSENCLQDR